MKSAKALRELLNSGQTIMAPSAYDGLSSRLVSLSGFDAVYASGGAIARSCGYPDIGLLSFSEVVERIEKIVEASDIPVIADADTGFGGTANVQRTVRALERCREQCVALLASTARSVAAFARCQRLVG